MELLDSRGATVGGTPVTRLLPKRAHRTVGPWCFADHFGPVDLGPAPTRDGAMAVGPHPHIGLQTVTWLFAGEVLHTDSVGSEQLIRPGQLNLMSAGRGISHAEESPDDATGEMHGLQLWVAQPDATRWSEPEFQHLAELPVVELGEATATVLVGELAEARSSARADWPMIGTDVVVRGEAEVPLDPTFEHAVLVMSGSPAVDGQHVPVGTTAYLAPGRPSVTLGGPARVVILGGAPFESTIAMSWNFVARTTEEIDSAYADWAAAGARFGEVRSELARIPAPAH